MNSFVRVYSKSSKMLQNPETNAEKSKEITINLLSAKSRALYIREYETFIQ